MAEYIEREVTCKNCLHVDVCQEIESLQCRKDFIWYQAETGCPYFKPTADVVEVRHGEWVYRECVLSYDGVKSGFSCSECFAFVEDDVFDMVEFHKSFCGSCGAKMDGATDTNVGDKMDGKGEGE